MIKSDMLKVFEMDKQVAKLAEQLEHLRYMQTSPTAARLGLGVQHSRNNTAAQDLSIKAAQVQEKLDDAIQELTQLEWEILQAIRNLPPMQKSIIIWRYICRLPWKQVAKKADMTEMQAQRHHNAAIPTLLFHVEHLPINVNTL
ncbi:MAG: hypothetical protein FWE21_07065 [Defluviitaleaceae bacterium]|nr:hypothetical protein [Defluviitaleaceae bacterium]